MLNHFNTPHRPRINNNASTARDFLARERNYLNNIKLVAALAFAGVAFLGHFKFVSHSVSGQPVPDHSQAYAEPLGIILFAVSLILLINSTYEIFAVQHKMSKQYAFTVKAAPWSGYLGLTLVAVVFAASVCVLVYEK